MAAPRRREELARLAGATGSSIDDDLAALAVREGCGALLGARVRAGHLAASPAATARLLAEHRTALANDILFGRAVAELEARLAGVPVLLLKGAALRRLGVFADGERSMCDVDVLVPAARWDEAAARLGPPLERPRRPLTTRHDYAVGVAVAGMPIELHRYLAARPLFAVDESALFRRADGVVPEATDLFVSLAIHAAKHGFALPYRAVLDGLALAPRVSPGAVWERARELGARVACAAYVALLLDAGLDASWKPLGAGTRARLLASTAPFSDGERPWRRTARIGFSVSPLRALAWAGQRGLLRLADKVASRFVHG